MCELEGFVSLTSIALQSEKFRLLAEQFFIVESGSSSTGHSKASQERVIKQLAALRKQLSVEEKKVQIQLDKNVVSTLH